MVLTEAGLAGIVAAVKEGRITFQRIQTYTLNAIIKKIVTVLFLVVGLIMTGQAILTPLLMVIVMVTGDFPLHVFDDGQRAPVRGAKFVAHRQLEYGRSRHGRLPTGLLHRRPGRRQISHESRNRGAENSGLRRLGVLVVRQPFMQSANAGTCGVLARASCSPCRRLPILQSLRHWPSAESQ
jgi:hypothetical protein